MVISIAFQSFKHFPLVRCFYFCSQCHSQSALAVQREGSRGAAWADPMMDKTGWLKTLFLLPGELFKRRKLLGLHWGHEKGCSFYVDQGEVSNARVTVSKFFVLSPSPVLHLVVHSLCRFWAALLQILFYLNFSFHIFHWLSFLAWDTSWTLLLSGCPSRRFFLFCVDLILSMPHDAQIKKFLCPVEYTHR